VTCLLVEPRHAVRRRGELCLRQTAGALDLSAEAEHDALLDEALEPAGTEAGDEEPRRVPTQIDDADTHEPNMPQRRLGEVPIWGRV